MDNPPAFPVTTGSDGGCLNEGMTLRDYFAAAVIPKIKVFTNTRDELNSIARTSYAMADAMLKAREQ